MMLALKLRQTWHQRIAISLIVVGGISARCQDSASGNSNIRAAMPEYIQEFFLSDAVRCQEKGELQFTLATESRHLVGTNAELQVEYGLTDRLQVAIEVPYGFVAHRDEGEIVQGWNSFNVGFLYQLIRSDRPFALSAGMAMDLPLSSRGELGYEPAILLARSFHKLQVHASVISEIEQWKPTFAYNVSAVYPIKHVWFPTFEFNGRRAGTNFFYVTPGLYRHLGHGTQIGIGIPLGVGGNADSRGIVLKTNWEFGSDNKPERAR